MVVLNRETDGPRTVQWNSFNSWNNTALFLSLDVIYIYNLEVIHYWLFGVVIIESMKEANIISNGFIIIILLLYINYQSTVSKWINVESITTISEYS